MTYHRVQILDELLTPFEMGSFVTTPAEAVITTMPRLVCHAYGRTEWRCEKTCEEWGYYYLGLNMA